MERRKVTYKMYPARPQRKKLESMYKFKKSKFRIAEVPTVAVIRSKGASKISKNEIFMRWLGLELWLWTDCLSNP